jgi:hypothetical protein
LQSIAREFVRLQQSRHAADAADYDLSQTFDRVTVLAAITVAKTAMVRNTPNSDVFLAAMLLHSRWNR